MIFLGVKGDLHSPRPGRAGGRPSREVWCNPHVGLMPACRKIRLHQLAERPAATRTKKLRLFSQRSGCAPLTFETIERFGDLDCPKRLPTPFFSPLIT